MPTPVPNYCNFEAYEQFVGCLSTLDTNDSLLEGAVAISRHFLDSSRCESVVWNVASLSDQILDRVRSRSPETLLAYLHDLLFDEQGFEGNTTNYYDIDNSLLPIVLETKQGIPITLCLLYKVVAETAGLRVEGINSPGHFLTRVYLSESESMIVDPFHRGRILTTAEALELVTGVTGQDVSLAKQLLPTCTHRQWLARILNNLQSVLLDQSRFDDVSAMRELLVALIDP
jgi:regulator of sirC expression with transglutaminase-like and TPR domain